MSRMIFCLGFIFLASPVFAGTWLGKLDRLLWQGDASLNQAEDAYEAGQYEDAAKKFEAASRRRSPAYDQVYNSAVSLYKDGKFEEAQKRFAEVEQSSDLGLKSRAAHNSGLSFVQLGKLEAARDELRKALSYDNDNRIIQENLAWIEEQLKNKQEKKEEEKKDDQQNTAQKDSKDDEKKQDPNRNQNDSNQQNADQKNQDQKNADQNQQKNADKDKNQQNSDRKEAKNDSTKQDSQQQNGEGQSKNENSPQPKEEQKTAGQNPEQKPGEKDQGGAGPQDEKKQDEAKEAGIAQNQDEKASKDEVQAAARAKASGMTLQDMKIQDAERLLRSIDDKVGRYPLNSSGGPKDDGKNW